MFQTVREEKIHFHQEGVDEDPDWVVKQCYLLMIAAVTEAEVGVDNLWKRGESGGRHKHPDFGQYVPKNVFKAFSCAAAFVFAEIGSGGMQTSATGTGISLLRYWRASMKRDVPYSTVSCSC